MNTLRCKVHAGVVGWRNFSTTAIRKQSRRPRFPWFNKHMKVTDPARQDPEHFEKLAHQLPLGLFSIRNFD
ncbi:unnamed protein product [Gongylonema pulchrum]|uniref:Uncharacterized protein n=1 Tax=Gongylonema pulchrum TaxID=637853 RepID=A0A183EGH1_9BILA|nr:unnamed protein product [Gongylonema pulchrum]